MLRKSRLTEADYCSLADRLIDRHGANAVYWTDLAIDELEAQGERWRADAWRTLRAWVLDRLSAPSEPVAVLVH
ncbi:MAG: hypothetical protein AAGL49_02465 [Pseudomonadota bacterium]